MSRAPPADGTPPRSGAAAATPPLPRQSLPGAELPGAAPATIARPFRPRTAPHAPAAGPRRPRWGGAGRTPRAAPAAGEAIRGHEPPRDQLPESLLDFGA